MPLLFLGTAHVSLALAFLFAACWPAAVAGFFYHAWLVGLVHLVTLGWISFSILGTIYIAGPLALRMEMPARRADYAAFACSIIGLIGMVGHFWIQEYGGMAWSAALITCGILYMTIRIVANAARAHMPRAVKLHIVLACVNFWLAASMGVLLAIDKVAHFLPGFVLTNVFAHAHLAALGWVTMMVIGIGYRMLPMIFPSRMPSGGSLYVTAILLEIGVLGLFTTLLVRSRFTVVFGSAIVAALLVFTGHIVWMRRRLVSKPAGAPSIDFALLHAAGAAASLFVASGIGMALLVAPASPRMLHAAAAYGVFGLVGFLAQIVVAMETRLLPMVTWFWAYAGSRYQVAPRPPHVMRDRTLQAFAFSGWTVGVPALGCGMFFESALLVSLGSWALVAGVVLGALDSVFVVMQGFRKFASQRAA
jgi:hypothetical protein